MKFFFSFISVGFLVSLYFLITDDAGSGMGWAVAVFGTIGVGVAVYNAVMFGSIMREGPSDPNAPK